MVEPCYFVKLEVSKNKQQRSYNHGQVLYDMVSFWVGITSMFLLEGIVIVF